MDAREQHAAGTSSKAELTRIEDACIRDAVAMQERVGIGAITDGEYRKRGWREFLYDKCDGFGAGDRRARVSRSDCTTARRAPPIREPKVTEKLTRREPLSADDFSALKTMTQPSDQGQSADPVGRAFLHRGRGARSCRLWQSRRAHGRPRPHHARGDRRPRRARLHLSADGRGAARRDLRSQQHGGRAQARRRSRHAHRPLRRRDQQLDQGPARRT